MSLALRRSARRWFGDTSVYARDPALPAFMADLARPWGLPWRPEVLAAGLGQTYGEMAEQLLPEVVRADEPVEVLVLAFGGHDVRPGRSAATYLSSICPGRPNAFAICEEGTLAPFTALRLLRSYAGTGRGVLVVAEQSTLHYPPAAEVVLPERHAAVVLLLDPAGPGRLAAVRQYAGLSTVEDTLAAEVAALAGDRGDVLLLTGPGLAGITPPDGVKHSPGPPGQPFTGPWWQLLDHDSGLVLVADAEAGELGLAAFDFTPADPTPHGGPPR